jgi:uncharacterized phage protein gp47/JayE
MLAFKEYDDIVSDMKNWIIANSDKVSDYNEGSVLTTKLEAFGRELVQFYIRTLVAYETYHKQIPGYTFNFQRQEAQTAGGDVVFGVNVAAPADRPIPAGTVVSTGSGLLYTTQEDGIILMGNTASDPISVLANDKGDAFNVPPGSVSVIVTPTGVDTVNNPAAIVNGAAQETETDYLRRFAEYIIGLAKSNLGGIKSGVRKVPGVASTDIVEHFPPVSDYNMTVYIDDGSGTASAALRDQVQAVVDGDGSQENPGLRGGGIHARVLAATKVTVAVTVSITTDGIIDKDYISFTVAQNVTTYINGLSIGEDVIRNELIQVIMEVSGVVDCNLTAPSGNTSITSDQIARVGTVTITWDN